MEMEIFGYERVESPLFAIRFPLREEAERRKQKRHKFGREKIKARFLRSTRLTVQKDLAKYQQFIRKENIKK